MTRTAQTLLTAPDPFTITRTGGCMPLSAWDARLEIGHTKIDDQHIALAATINRLHAAMLAGADRTEIERILVSLKDDTVLHFRLEEELMEQSHFVDLAPHRESHRDLLQQLVDLVEGHQRGAICVTTGMTDFLRDWLTRHIQTEDLRLVKFLRQQKR